MAAPLAQGVGYGVVVGVGLLFAFGMVFITMCLRRYQRERIDSEEFATAGRTVKTGLIASAVVSSWTWAATLLTSTARTYQYGLSGGLFYAIGGSVQIVLFATLAIEVKRKVPGAHTYLEIVRARYGRWTHGVFMFYAFAANILVTAMLITGGSATVQTLTGMHPIASIFLLPLGVVIYTLFGGLKATFLTDYVHTIILYVIIFLFTFTVYANNDIIGSPGRMYDLLTQLADRNPVSGNQNGSFLTMRSEGGAKFMVIDLVGGFGTVFLDNGYWNKAIAASPKSTLPGYVYGGLSWFAVPWVAATTLGLGALVLEQTPAWPGYPTKMTAEEVSAGIALPNAAVALLGKGGGGAALLLVFMAMTSAFSAELVSSSSIWTYDIYRCYINPKASSRQLIYMTHAAVIVFTLAMCGFSIGLYYAGISLGWLFNFMGLILGGAVIPLCLCVFWDKFGVWSATISPPLAMALGIMGWMSVTSAENNHVFTVSTTGADNPMLTGNVISLLSPLIIIPICHLLERPQKKFDFTEELELQVHEEQSDASRQLLNRYAVLARYVTLAIVLGFLIIWPWPMYGSKYVFSKPFFTGWIVVGIIWLFFSLFTVVLMPLWQGRSPICHTILGLYWDLSGQSSRVQAWQKTHPSELHHVISPLSEDHLTVEK